MAVLLIDVEMTCWETDQEHEEHRAELIEIGAVMASSTSRHQKLDTFSRTIKPKVHAELSDFCENLTGITQIEIDNAEGFSQVWDELRIWCTDYKIYEWFSWGPADQVIIERECKDYGQRNFLPSHVDLAKVFTKRTGKKRGRRGAMKYLDIKVPEDRLNHRGVHDAMDVYDLWEKMSRLGWLCEKDKQIDMSASM